MQGKQAANGLNKGMSLDTDVQYVENSSYRYSMNGSIIYNKDGTYSWKTLRGNKISINIQPRNGTDVLPYKILGNTGNDNIRIIYLRCSAINASEIGIFCLNPNGTGTYKTLFNDQDDPNGDKLNFQLHNQIEARFLYENPNCIRTYWVDGVNDDSNQPRTFTFKYDPTLGSIDNANSYVGLTDSVHDMDSQAAFNMGLIKYVQSIGGGLLSGVYQYMYRLQTNEGYLTPWYPATNRIIVSASSKNSTNSNLYEYSQSGLATSIGNLIEIKGVDERYDKIDVAYMYSTNPSIVSEAKIFEQVDITSDIMQFKHVSNDGEPLIVEEIPAVFLGLRKAKTLNIKDSTLYYGNTVEGVLFDFDPELVLSGCTIKPIFRDMRSDVYPDAVGAIPLEASRTSTFKTKIRMFTGYEEEYDVVGDYSNYDGTQIDHLYPGYWRGEFYRIGIVFYDKLGYQSFVYHIADIQMPEQYDDTYSWTRIKEDGTTVVGAGVLPEKAWTTNNFCEFVDSTIIDGEVTSTRNYSHLRIMGIEVNGLDLSSIKDQVSGFKIVRTKLERTILMQGLIMPCVQDGVEVYPLPTSNQSFSLGTMSLGDIIAPGQTNISYLGLVDRDSGDKFKLRHGVSTLYAPDYDFGFPLPSLQSNDELQIVGSVWAASNASGSGLANFNHYFIQPDHAVTKYHYSKNEFHVNCEHPYPHYNDRIKMFAIEDVGPQSNPPLPFFGNLNFRNYNNMKNADDFGFSAGFKLENWGKYKTILVQHDNIYANGWTPAGYLYSPMFRLSNSHRDKYGNYPMVMGSLVVNYKRPNVNPYGGATLSGLANSVFISTGHFQPIDNPTFTMPAGYVFNNVEVWGGDCWLDYHTQLRLYPDNEDDTPNSGGSYADYAVGMSFPLESPLNHRLRYSNSSPKLSYPNVGSRSANSFINNVTTNFDTGLYMDFVTSQTEVIEQFNLNQILFFSELTFFYNPKPIEFKDNTHYPMRWRFTLNKFYGDIVDTWRTFQVNDFRDLNGTYGQITSSIYILNQIYSFQERAFGRLRASDRAMIESPNAGSLTTGVGDKLDGIDYISTEYGNQHQWSLFSSDNTAYWVDNNNGKIMRFGQDGKNTISDNFMVHQFVTHESPYFYNNDNPVQNNGITGGYDFDNDIAWFSFKRNRELRALNGTSNIVINSRSVTSNSIDNYTIEQGDTCIINWTYSLSNTYGVVIPFNNTSSLGENTNKYFYLHNNGYAVNVFVDKAGVKTLLFKADPQSYYILYRNNIESDWLFIQVSKIETPEQRGTILYSEKINSFVSFNGINPSLLIQHKNKLLNTDYENEDYTINSLYINGYGGKGEIFGEKHRSIIDIPVNDAALLPKVFDSIRVNCNKFFNNKLIEVILTTDNQFERLNMATDTRANYLEDVLRFPLRGENQIDRMRGKHIIVRLILDNTDEQDDLLTNILTYYRQSNRY